MEEAMQRRKIIPYNPHLKKLAQELRNNSTKAEKKLWPVLKTFKESHGYDFHRQKPIGNYILDFFCHELMLGIECDGATHHHEEVWEMDRIKEDYMQSIGITVLRFTDEEVLKDPNAMIPAIENYILAYEKHTPAPLKRGK